MPEENKYNKIKPKDNMKVENKEEEKVEEPKEKKNLQKVVDVAPKKVKKSLIGRLVTGILGPEGVSGIGSYVNDEIIKPAIKNIIVDSVTSGINMIMYGDRGPNRGGGRLYHNQSSYRPRTRYTNHYTSQQPEPAKERKTHRSARYGVEDYLITDRYDATHVLTSLTENADMYGSVSAADYYDLIGVESVYTDNNYGWTLESINKATIMPTRGGYIIKFPPVEII